LAIDELTADFAGHPDLAQALYRIARQYEQRPRNYHKAKSIYQAIVNDFPDSEHGLKAELNVSKINVILRIESGEDSDAESAIDSLIADSNDFQRLPGALYRIAEKYRRAGQYADANDIYQEIIEQYPDDSGADLSKYWIHSAIIAHEEKHHSDWYDCYDSRVKTAITVAETITVDIDCDPYYSYTYTCQGTKSYWKSEIDDLFDWAWEYAGEEFDDPETEVKEEEVRAYEVENAIEQPVSDALPEGCGS